MATFNSPVIDAIFRDFSRRLDATLKALEESAHIFDTQGAEAAEASLAIHLAVMDADRKGILNTSTH